LLPATLEKPPEDSIHVTWRDKGLATYLLCMLLKQHTFFGKLGDSTISLQASQNRKDSAHCFYLTLGFEGYEYPRDNGLSQTHYSFQLEVHRRKELWVSPKKTAYVIFSVASWAAEVARQKDCS
jgi:hypothetical protein